MIVQFYRTANQKIILVKELNIDILPEKGTIVKHFNRLYRVSEVMFDIETCKYSVQLNKL